MQEKSAKPGDMLAVLDSFVAERKQTIAADDHAYCQTLQKQCYEVLDNLQAWYDLLRKEAEALMDQYAITFTESGKVIAHQRKDRELPRNIFDDLRFLIFKQIDDLVDRYVQACNLLGREVVEYFNTKYHLHIPYPDVAEPGMMGARPDYATYVDHVVGSLGGMSFHQKAEEEIIQRAMKAVCRNAYHPLPQCKGNKIQLYGMIELDDFWRREGRNMLAGDSEKHLSDLCAGLALFAQQSTVGDLKYLSGFNPREVDTKKLYDLPTNRLSGIRVYANGRLDVHFPSPALALECFVFLRFYSIGC